MNGKSGSGSGSRSGSRGSPAGPSLARSIAAEVLLRVERDGAYGNTALEAALAERPGIDRRDAALASELVHGVLRRQLALDHALSWVLDRPASQIEFRVLILLRLGAYQIRYLDRVPVHAAVNESVELCKVWGLARASGLCNAALRRLARDPDPPAPGDALLRLSIEESHPLWLVQRWVARLGLESARQLCEANNRPAPLMLRINLGRGTVAALEARLREAHPDAVLSTGRFAPEGIQIAGAGPASELPGYREGLFQVQDEAAQLVSRFCLPLEGAALDICAAPGGKACHLAELGARSVVAVDLSARKLQRVRSEAARLGLARVFPVTADARSPLPLRAGSFSHVLVDAPCSGLGTLRRHPEVRYRRTAEDLGRLASLQWQILLGGVGALAPGGVLVFAVCSNEPEEGEDHLRRLLAERPDLELAEPAAGWASAAGRELARDGTFQSWPHRHGIDGFHAFRVRRRG
jgi:16S rRNA (cytosine967-C5)-methyltransferase